MARRKESRHRLSTNASVHDSCAIVQTGLMLLASQAASTSAEPCVLHGMDNTATHPAARRRWPPQNRLANTQAPTLLVTPTLRSDTSNTTFHESGNMLGDALNMFAALFTLFFFFCAAMMPVGAAVARLIIVCIGGFVTSVWREIRMLYKSLAVARCGDQVEDWELNLRKGKAGISLLYKGPRTVTGTTPRGAPVDSSRAGLVESESNGVLAQGARAETAVAIKPAVSTRGWTLTLVSYRPPARVTMVSMAVQTDITFLPGKRYVTVCQRARTPGCLGDSGKPYQRQESCCGRCSHSTLRLWVRSCLGLNRRNKTQDCNCRPSCPCYDPNRAMTLMPAFCRNCDHGIETNVRRHIEARPYYQKLEARHGSAAVTEREGAARHSSAAARHGSAAARRDRVRAVGSLQQRSARHGGQRALRRAAGRAAAAAVRHSDERVEVITAAAQAHYRQHARRIAELEAQAAAAAQQQRAAAAAAGKDAVAGAVARDNKRLVARNAKLEAENAQLRAAVAAAAAPDVSAQLAGLATRLAACEASAAAAAEGEAAEVAKLKAELAASERQRAALAADLEASAVATAAAAAAQIKEAKEEHAAALDAREQQHAAALAELQGKLEAAEGERAAAALCSQQLRKERRQLQLKLGTEEALAAELGDVKSQLGRVTSRCDSVSAQLLQLRGVYGAVIAARSKEAEGARAQAEAAAAARDALATQVTQQQAQLAAAKAEGARQATAAAAAAHERELTQLRVQLGSLTTICSEAAAEHAALAAAFTTTRREVEAQHATELSAAAAAHAVALARVRGDLAAARAAAAAAAAQHEAARAAQQQEQRRERAERERAERERAAGSSAQLRKEKSSLETVLATARAAQAAVAAERKEAAAAHAAAMKAVADSSAQLRKDKSALEAALAAAAAERKEAAAAHAAEVKTAVAAQQAAEGAAAQLTSALAAVTEEMQELKQITKEEVAAAAAEMKEAVVARQAAEAAAAQRTSALAAARVEINKFKETAKVAAAAHAAELAKSAQDAVEAAKAALAQQQQQQQQLEAALRGAAVLHGRIAGLETELAAAHAKVAILSTEAASARRACEDDRAQHMRVVADLHAQLAAAQRDSGGGGASGHAQQHCARR
ncbi:hypothetical protein JKP88DRAFT_250904 [Tribonema minus]|uniref:Uncharacterized protein n=1 Tax=Tribonema minus TaxID=303371 RepID=A0A836CQX9_9STRA|nr:hypothetical protein JKP88DRAFT_250904 [Tribonema minus]